LRGLDHGKGLDLDGALRTIGSYQADELKSHTHSEYETSGTGSGRAINTDYTNDQGISSGAIIATGGTETRMKNVAVDWLVYATTLQYDLTVGGGNATQLGGYASSYYAKEADRVSGLIGNRFYFSTPQAITPTSAYTITHNLGLIDLMRAEATLGIKCISPELNYVVNDIVYNPAVGNTNSPTYALHATPQLNSNTCKFYISSWGLGLFDPTGALLTNITPAKWQIFVKITY